MNLRLGLHLDPGKDHIGPHQRLAERVVSALDAPNVPPVDSLTVLRKSYDPRLSIHKGPNRFNSTNFVYSVLISHDTVCQIGARPVNWKGRCEKCALLILSRPRTGSVIHTLT
jgi:hypothetical protein